MSYVDGFLLPVPKKHLKAYVAIAKKAGKIWMEHGALAYQENVGEDMAVKGMMAFPKVLKPKAGEVVVFSWIIFKSRAHRDKVNAKVMKDPRLAEMMNLDAMPFDCKRMCYGGFTSMVVL